MNTFTHKKTTITESQFDFSQIENGVNYNGEGTISVTISVPKDPDANRMVVCTLEVGLGGDTDKLKLRVVSQSSFSIEGEIDKATLQQDAQEVCYPEAARRTKEKIAEITRLHVGMPLNIPIPQKLQ